jgi:hypothetical protein
MQKLACSVEDARSEIEEILNSGVFTRSSRQARLLEYLFEKMLTGEAADLKEYTIAVEVFGKPEDFDQHTDATVRVEAHRLRKKLQKYYDTSGRDRPLQVALPAGHYSLSFERGGWKDAGRMPRLFAVTAMRRLAYWGIAAGVLLLITLYYVQRGNDSGTEARAVAPMPTVGSGSTALATADPEPDAIRILAGYSGDPHVDVAGRRWLSDRFFEGGDVRNVLSERISRTGRPELFQRAREGNFRYRVPLAPGEYELRLYFVDPDGPEGERLERFRIFEVFVNERLILEGYDVAASVGYDADVQVFARLEPNADGILDIRFNPIRSRAVVSAIEIMPMLEGQPRPVRIIAQSQPFRDNLGRFWSPDDFYSGGRVDGYTAMIQGSPDPGILSGERYGNFEYFIPVPKGEYQLTLYFGEAWFGPLQNGGGSVGSRVFDVLLNRELILDKLDLLREKPPTTLVTKTFRRVTPGRSGKIHLAFHSHANWAEIRAIEVVPEEAQAAAGP